MTDVRIGEWNTATANDCSRNDKNFCAPPFIDNRIVETVIHPEYNKKSQAQNFDIALLRLARRVKFNDFVQPICLPLDPALLLKDYTGHSFTVAG